MMLVAVVVVELLAAHGTELAEDRHFTAARVLWANTHAVLALCFALGLVLRGIPEWGFALKILKKNGSKNK